MLTIGTHMSIAGGIAKTAKDVVKMNANTMQIFSRNPRGSSFKIYEQEEIDLFQKIRKENSFGPILAHAPYTMNLASATEKTYEFAAMVMREDVKRMEALGIEYLVFHPGSHTGIGVDSGIDNIVRGLNQAITGDEKIMVLLETMSGKGTEIGRNFEELKMIRDKVEHPERVGVCLDTCHVFSAGYDIVNDLDGVLDEFDRILGLDLLKTIHLNDSMMPFGANKDRHEVFGGGLIGEKALLNVLKHPKLKHLPFYLETPLDDAGHKEEIAKNQGAAFMKEAWTLKTIAYIRTDFPAKFGIPRQSGLADTKGKIFFEPEYRSIDALRELEQYSHLWLIWGFSECEREEWKATVRPPRLGGNKRVGVFATRSPFRPNPIGLSCVGLEKVEMDEEKGPVIYVSGVDMMDMTPIYDIKPYLPYVDSHPEASGGFAEENKDYKLEVEFPEELLMRVPEEKRETLVQILSQDVRPSYQNDPKRLYGMEFAGLEVKFQICEKKVIVKEVFEL